MVCPSVHPSIILFFFQIRENSGFFFLLDRESRRELGFQGIRVGEGEGVAREGGGTHHTFEDLTCYHYMHWPELHEEARRRLYFTM